ncbi:hypothetical protein [Metallibacterium scheffleri]|nr:hypothetical protein [Metallibacterium scheffleri]
MAPKNPRLPHIEMAVELYKAAPSGDRLSYRLSIDGEPVAFERLRGAKRLLADALLGLAVSDHGRRKSMNAVDPDQITGPPGPPTGSA